MTETVWRDVDLYIADRLVPADPVLDAVLAANAAAGLPPHDVSPPQGKLLNLLARMAGARRILEIGTLGGYSTIWLARALPDGGTVVTLEADPAHAEVARENFVRAGLTDRIDLRTGRALDTLPTLAGGPLFDLIFIDADKPSNPDYLVWSLRLSRPGTVIVADNVVREGAVADAGSDDPSVRGVRRFFNLMEAEPRLDATAIQTVGAKGYDGFAIAVVKG
jgi:predicted O-methyltransferase YrrM